MCTKSIKLLILSCIFLLAVNSIALCQVVEAWVATYNGSGNGHDFATDLIIDKEGNLYVTGTIDGNASTPDMVTIKYNQDGDTLWVRRFNGPGDGDDQGSGLALDNSGNLYVAGYTFIDTLTYRDYCVIKYTPLGDTVWVRTYNGPGDGDDNCIDVEIDKYGNVFVTGQSTGEGTYYDFATIKFSPSGDILWVSRYAGTGYCCYYDRGLVLAPDDSGNVCVTGYSEEATTGSGFSTIKYNSDGDTLWLRRYSPYYGGNESPSDLLLDVSGNVYVAGTSNMSDLGNASFTTIKYSTTGELLWARHIEGTDGYQDYAMALALDSSGNLLVAGGTGNSVSGSDFTTAKYAPDGDTVWVRYYSRPGSDIATEIAVDETGNVYVAGQSQGGPSLTDFAVVKYSAEGESLWVARYNGNGNGDDLTSAMALDMYGNMYVTGYSWGSSGTYDFATVKWSSCAIPGDANSNGSLALSDVIAVVNFIFGKSGFPDCYSNNEVCWLTDLLCRGDWNGNSIVTLSDVIQGINFIFSKPGGPWNPLPSGACCLPAP